MSLPTTAVLGAGTMAGAVLDGLRRGGRLDDTEIRTTNRTRSGADRWVGRGVQALAVEETPDANRRAAAGAGLILLATKPAMVVPLLREISEVVGPGAVVVSLAAGVTLATISAELPASVTVVRTVPNTPSLVGRGMTGLSAAGDRRSAELQLVEDIFRTLGEVLWVEEDQLHALAATSGSGPAYFYFLLTQFTAAAVERGLSPDQAAQLTRATFIGSAELLRVSAADPAELQAQVTSPRGSTEQAIRVLEASSLDTVFGEAMDAAMLRTRQLGGTNP